MTATEHQVDAAHPPKLRPLRTAKMVIEALGGTAPLARDLGLTYRCVFNWRKFSGTIPSAYYPYMIDRLHKIGLTARHELWGIHIPKGYKMNGHGH
jgi:hypothetical protein